MWADVDEMQANNHFERSNHCRSDKQGSSKLLLIFVQNVDFEFFFLYVWRLQ